jgi:hypothetical protein
MQQRKSPMLAHPFYCTHFVFRSHVNSEPRLTEEQTQVFTDLPEEIS